MVRLHIGRVQNSVPYLNAKGKQSRMTILTRRILSIAFSVGFVLIAVPLLASTAGYRFDWSHFRFQRTGLLVIDVAPYPDRLFLDGKRVKPRGDPVRLTFVPPGSHTVRMEKDGHFPWEATASVTPGQATRLNAIRLIRNDAPVMLASNVTAVCASKDGRSVAFAQGASVSITAMPEARTTALATLNSPVTTCAVADNSAYVFTRSDTAVTHMTVADATVVTLSIPASTNRVVWDTKHPGRAYALLDDRRLFLLDFGQTTLAPLTDRVLGLTVHDGTLYLIRETDSGNRLLSREADGRERRIGTLPVTSAAWTLIAPSGDALPVIADDQTLYLISLSKGTSSMSVADATTAVWSPNGKVLATAGSLELKLLSPETMASSLLLRTSTPYTNVSWVDDNHLLALHGDAVEWLELQNTDLLTITSFPQRPIAALLLVGSNSALLLRNGELFAWTLT